MVRKFTFHYSWTEGNVFGTRITYLLSCSEVKELSQGVCFLGHLCDLTMTKVFMILYYFGRTLPILR